jgi:hypothetical protein
MMTDGLQQEGALTPHARERRCYNGLIISERILVTDGSQRFVTIASLVNH